MFTRIIVEEKNVPASIRSTLLRGVFRRKGRLVIDRFQIGKSLEIYLEKEEEKRIDEAPSVFYEFPCAVFIC